MKIGRVVLIALAGALTFASGAHADMAGLVGNTVVLTTPDNNTIKVQLHADGTYQTVMSNGPGAKGTWKGDNGQLCYTQTDPAPAPGRPNPFCAQGMDGKKVGDTWTQPGMGGGTMNGAVVAGQ